MSKEGILDLDSLVNELQQPEGIPEDFEYPKPAEDGPMPLTFEPEMGPEVEHFFQLAELYRPLLSQIKIMIPVRPTDGLSPQLAQMLTIWALAGIEWGYMEDSFGGFIECTRARMAHEFVTGSNLGYVLMLDSDMKPPLHLPYMLVRWQAPVVGSVAVSINADHGPMLCLTRKDTNGDWRYPRVFGGQKVPAKGLASVGAVGTGAMLIRRDVLEAFDYDSPESEIPFFLPERIRRQGFKTGHLKRGEDVQFCLQARQMGFEVAVDMEAVVGHRKGICFTLEPALRDESLDAEAWVVPPEGMISAGSSDADDG